MQFSEYRTPNIRPGIEYVYGPIAVELGTQIVETEAEFKEEETIHPEEQTVELSPEFASPESIPERDEATATVNHVEVAEPEEPKTERPVAFSAALSRLLPTKR